MSLYALGDLHLHFQSPLRAPGQMNGAVWKNHEALVRKYCVEMIRPEDTLVLVGDHSWGRNLDECGKDMEFIMSLPGRKILLRGNHDMFWDAKKTQSLNDKYAGKLLFLQNNYYPYGEYALVGTKGFTFEGPFLMNRRGQVTGWDREEEQRAEKLVEREMDRLRVSFEAAANDGFTRFIMFLHYPPTNIMERVSGFTKMAEEYHAEQVIYAHCHGESRYHDSIIGVRKGIQYSLVSGDYLRWKPMKVLD